MCNKDNDCDCHGNSSFIFGVLIGATIGAVIAVVIYKNRKSQVISNLKSTLEEYFDKFVTSQPPVSHPKRKQKSSTSTKPKSDSKIPVTLPRNIIALSTPKPTTSKPSKMFLKPKKA